LEFERVALTQQNLSLELDDWIWPICLSRDHDGDIRIALLAVLERLDEQALFTAGPLLAS
jgi:hypothetical protein